MTDQTGPEAQYRRAQRLMELFLKSDDPEDAPLSPAYRDLLERSRQRLLSRGLSLTVRLEPETGLQPSGCRESPDHRLQTTLSQDFYRTRRFQRAGKRLKPLRDRITVTGSLQKAPDQDWILGDCFSREKPGLSRCRIRQAGNRLDLIGAILVILLSLLVLPAAETLWGFLLTVMILAASLGAVHLIFLLITFTVNKIQSARALTARTQTLKPGRQRWEALTQAIPALNGPGLEQVLIFLAADRISRESTETGDFSDLVDFTCQGAFRLRDCRKTDRTLWLALDLPVTALRDTGKGVREDQEVFSMELRYDGSLQDLLTAPLPGAWHLLSLKVIDQDN